VQDSRTVERRHKHSTAHFIVTLILAPNPPPKQQMSKLDSFEATAYPVAYATTAPYEENIRTTHGSGVYFVDLPVGVANIGIEFQRSPPVITDIDRTICPVVNQVFIGHYCHGIILPNVEIVNLLDVAQLQGLIQLNAGNPRRLICSNSAFYFDAAVASSSSSSSQGQQQLPPGVLYKYTLPHNVPDLGFTMIGFPPVISQIQPHSAMDGLLRPHFTVEALLVPREPIFNLHSGAFTSAKVHERLAASTAIPGRQLVVKEAPLQPREKGSNAAFDLKTFTNSSSWSLNRMFGVKKK
jgi:hypothetical protein